ncbi:MAG: hypothetical protein WC992_08995 [Acholeplasmataceae bacterium]|jgi:phosphotransferase system IIB component|nr:hypothetical protein [Acholeplasmataceae bacterium]
MFELTNDQLIILGITASVILILIIFLFFLKKKKPKETITESLPVDELIIGLGGISNIQSVSMEHQRLKVSVENIKQVDQSILRKLEIPAVLKGKELTLLIKHHTKAIYTQLVEQKKEVN